jgi:hypothetical protein
MRKTQLFAFAVVSLLSASLTSVPADAASITCTPFTGVTQCTVAIRTATTAPWAKVSVYQGMMSLDLYLGNGIYKSCSRFGKPAALAPFTDVALGAIGLHAHVVSDAFLIVNIKSDGSCDQITLVQTL